MTTITLESDSSHSPPIMIIATAVPLISRTEGRFLKRY